MSTTVTLQKTEMEQPIGDLGKFQFIDPDLSVDPWKCDYLAVAKAKNVIQEILPLHDIRTASLEGSGTPSLLTHGFQAVKHQSKLFDPPYARDSFNDSDLLENIYFPEVCDILRNLTGASDFEIINCGTRLKHADPPPKLTSEVKDPADTTERCGVPIDPSKVDLTKPFIAGHRQEDHIGPVRSVHIDYSLSGARAMLRHLRPSIRNKALDIIAAEDSDPPVPVSKTRRYAIYSVWRPLKKVVNDPLAVCDPGSIDTAEDLVEFFNKHPSAEETAFLGGSYIMLGRRAKQSKWYWIKNQLPDDVLVVQFFDSHAETEERPVGVVHGSPELQGLSEQERQEPRESIEVRVCAFW